MVTEEACRSALVTHAQITKILPDIKETFTPKFIRDN